MGRLGDGTVFPVHLLHALQKSILPIRFDLISGCHILNYRPRAAILKSRFGLPALGLYMANWHSSGDWQFKQPVAMALPTVILKAGWLQCWAVRFLSGRVAR